MSLRNTSRAGHALLDVFPSPDEGLQALLKLQLVCNMNNGNSKASDSRMGCSKALGSTQSRAAPAPPEGEDWR